MHFGARESTQGFCSTLADGGITKTLVTWHGVRGGSAEETSACQLALQEQEV